MRRSPLKSTYDIISFDFAKAFEKAPHWAIVRALIDHGIRGAPLMWFISFLRGRTQQVRVGESYSSIVDVISGVVQGTVVGPGLYTVFVDSLFRKIRLPSIGYADDFKFIADVVLYSTADVQHDINTIVQWSDDNYTPLSIEKCGVLHCGAEQPNRVYYIKGSVLKSVDNFKDLGVVRSTAANHTGHYQAHYQQVAAKAAQVSGSIRRIFRSRSRELLWPAFQIYVLPLLMQCSPVWNPALKRDISVLESVQRRYTSCISGLKGLSYSDRLKELGALTLEKRRTFADMVTVYKFMHNGVNCSAADVGLTFRNTNTRGGHNQLEQPIVQRAFDSYFCYRVPSVWNKLKPHIVSATSLRSFKKFLLTSLLQQYGQ